MSILVFLATFGGAGVHLPSGLATGIALVVGLAWFWFLQVRCPRAVWVAVGVLVVAVSLVIEVAEAALGADASQIILDEFVAVPFLFLFYVPWRHPGALLSIVGALIAFGTFDNLKPFGLRALEQLPGGFGVVMDDVGAAVVASAVVWLTSTLMLKFAANGEVEGKRNKAGPPQG